jgi:hypothetical protein
MLCLGRSSLDGSRAVIVLAGPHHARPSRAAGSFVGPISAVLWPRSDKRRMFAAGKTCRLTKRSGTAA